MKSIIKNVIIAVACILCIFCLTHVYDVKFKATDESAVDSGVQSTVRISTNIEGSRRVRDLEDSKTLTLDEIYASVGPKQSVSQIIDFFGGQQNYDLPTSRIIYSALNRQLDRFSDGQLFELYQAHPSSLMVMTISKYIPERVRTTQQLAALLGEFRKKELGKGRDVSVLLRGIAHELGKKSSLVRTGNGINEVVNALGSKDVVALNYMAIAIKTQLANGLIVDSDNFFNDVFTVVHDETILRNLVDVYVEDQIKNDVSYKELADWTLEMKSQIARYASKHIIQEAYKQKDFDWAVDYVNDFIEQSKSDVDSRSVVSDLATLMVKDDPRMAIDWAMEFPDSASGKHTAVIKAFFALNRMDREASLRYIDQVKSEDTKRSMRAIDRDNHLKRLNEGRD